MKNSIRKELKEHLNETIEYLDSKLDKTIYVHESHTLWSDNGEVYLACDNGTVVFNADTLFNDIANLAELALKERKKQEKYILKELTKIK
jgi:hypothetical protein